MEPVIVMYSKSVAYLYVCLNITKLFTLFDCIVTERLLGMEDY